MTDDRLPVHDVAAPLLDALREHGCAILSAPTGSGKSTLVPQMLHASDAVRGQIIVTQPRRLAARMLARRVAELVGEPLGATVGYQTRHERVVSERTKIRFVTEGLLLRLLQSERALSGVGAVIFDEFHERNVACDVALALVRQLQQRHRSDLRLLVMSATLEVERLQAYLAAPLIETAMRAHPVAVRYLVRHSRDPVWDLTADALRAVLSDEQGGAGEADAGDVLIFMPGVYEIRRTIDACRAVAGGAFALHALHGRMPAAEQDAAVVPGPRRKVIVATNVAETSLTIPNVRYVIDSGLAKLHRYDARRGINVLLTEPISQASAEQRAGRAGRTAPGTCYRLWTEFEQRGRAAQTLPEIRRMDLAEVALPLLAMGEDPRSFPWLEPPADDAVERAMQQLEQLGAVDSGGRLTARGRTMALMPMHPRLGRLLVSACEAGVLHRAALWAALISEPDVIAPGAEKAFADELGPQPASDLLVREQALQFAQRVHFDPQRCAGRGVNASACREVDRTWKLFLQTAKRHHLDQGDAKDDPEIVIQSLLQAFADHVAVRRNSTTRHCAMVGGRSGTLDRASVVDHAQLLLPIELREVAAKRNVSTVFSLASRLERRWLVEWFPQHISRRTQTQWDPELRAVESVERLYYLDLVLEETRREADADAAASILAERVAAGELELTQWDEAVEQWIARTRCVARWFTERELLSYDDDELAVIRLEICSGARRYSQIRDRPCLNAVRQALSWDDQQFVERMAPARIALPSGWRMPVTYHPGAPPRGRARIQDLFGMNDSPRVAGGRQTVLLEILGPNFRPLQVTDDLGNFWQQLYPTLKKQLQRRYPRHEWR